MPILSDLYEYRVCWGSHTTVAHQAWVGRLHEEVDSMTRTKTRARNENTYISNEGKFVASYDWITTNVLNDNCQNLPFECKVPAIYQYSEMEWSQLLFSGRVSV